MAKTLFIAQPAFLFQKKFIQVAPAINYILFMVLPTFKWVNSENHNSQ